MPDCFISYSSEDERLANFVQQQLRDQHVTVFMASVSLRPGQNWSQEIWANLRTSPWVIFLASRAACFSPYVQQELGAALAAEKKIIPVVWDMTPAELPGWINQTHALDLRHFSMDDLRQVIGQIAQEIRTDKEKGLLAIGAIFLGILWFASD